MLENGGQVENETRSFDSESGYVLCVCVCVCVCVFVHSDIAFPCVFA